MSADRVIHVEGVSKRYWKLEERGMLLRSLLPFRGARRSEFWALRDVDLDVSSGESVGILGRNGSGKTTLLRLLSGVSRPTAGRLRVVGRVAPLISVGVGFKREMSGRENVYLNGMLLGLTREELDERFDDIVAFAELKDFIDTPVKFYSSGMFLRLGFSVAIHTEPDIFLLDEILAVGDLSFQGKCVRRMQEIRERGATIVFVSHNIQAVRRVCGRGILLRGGQLDFDGDTETAVTRLHQQLSEESHDGSTVGLGRWSYVGGAEIVHREIRSGPRAGHVVERGVPLTVRVVTRFQRPADSPLFGITVYAEDGSVVYGRHSTVGGRYRRFAAGEEAEFTAVMVPHLAGGTYRVATRFLTADGRGIIAYDEASLYFFVERIPGVAGFADLAADLSVDGAPIESDADQTV